MRKLILLLPLLVMTSCSAPDAPDAIAGLLERILPDDAGRFVCRLAPDTMACDYFVLESDGNNVLVSGNDELSIAAGINHYLNRYAGVNLSWGNMRASLSDTLPVVHRQLHRCRLPLRYYLNFCTHSYSMAFWDEERWMEEIDLMALHGINMPLVTEGFEVVWREMLRRQGYDAKTIDAYLPGPAYYAWFLMDNLTGWGGPVPDGWYEKRLTLARKIFNRMGEYCMTPVVPGYVGMVPEGAETGLWCGFRRPALVADSLTLRRNASCYYAVADSLFGDVMPMKFFAIDPFHEGGSVPPGVDRASYTNTLFEALDEAHPDAVWVVQHWQHNPMQYLTHTVPQGRLLILDLHGDTQCDTVCGGNATDADGRPHDWVWCSLTNYGGNVGLFGRVGQTIATLQKAMAAKDSTALVGVGFIPEGIGSNPVSFDLLYDLPWRDKPIDTGKWLSDYVAGRYGVKEGSGVHTVMKGVWRTLAEGILNCRDAAQQGCTESVLMMRPDSVPGPVSSWAFSSWYWSRPALRQAAETMLSLADSLADRRNYRYDLVDITRQCVADKAYELLGSYAGVDKDERRRIGDKFLRLLSAQDYLLATIPVFCLSRYTEEARAWGDTPAEKDLYEKNLRMLITTWGDRYQAETGELRDYGNREWSGMLSAYYAPRWKAWFDAAAGRTPTFDWFGDFEQPFVEGRSVPYGAFADGSAPDAVEKVRETLFMLNNM